MRTAGRPRIGERVAVRLPPALLARLDERAAGAGVSRAAAMRAILEDALRAGADGVDRTQIAARLALTPAERVARLGVESRRLAVLRGRASDRARRATHGA